MIHLRIGLETMIGARIAKEMKLRDWSEGELARRSGVNQPTIHRIITGESKNPRRDNVERVAKALGVSVEWLWSGNPRLAPSLAAEEASSSQGDSAAQPLENQEPEYPRTPHEDDYALIPQYTARGGCGAGFLNGHVEVKGSLAFKREWLAKMKAKPENLRVMYAHGESMEPYIFEGEVVLFDISEKEPRDKKVFVIRRPDGDISIKRLAQRLDGTWIVSSDNPDKTRFRDETYLPDALHEIPIVGRVIWRGGEVD